MDLAIFDLDGTLIDSKLDLAHSVNAALDHLGLSPLPNETVYSYVGNGAPVLIRRSLGAGASQADVDQALAFFLEYYRAHMLDNTVLYPGVRTALDRMMRAGIPLAVLTNKPVRISEAIVEGLGLSGHFQYVYGGNSFEQKKPHPIGIDTLVSKLNARREHTVMVGDSGVDIDTARAAGVQACGVSYGFAPETLKSSPPDFFVDSLEELADRAIPV
jgi:phosphoglycolate phosphatase